MIRRLVSLVSVLLVSTAAYAAPCTTATAGCTEWVTLGSAPARSLIYRTYPLDTKNEKIIRALVMIHGAGRDADNYFRTAVAAAFLADALEDTIVIAPRFASNDGSGCRDTLAPNEINWPCSGNSWRSGGVAVGDDRLTSYDLADEILRRLARKDVFPNLKAIVVAGHSAGGQYTTRYEMANQVHDTLGVPRLARGQAFAGYVNQKYGAQHTVTVIPLCGHNARCMFTAERALPILFPKR
jgi:hypothetical protein